MPRLVLLALAALASSLAARAQYSFYGYSALVFSNVASSSASVSGLVDATTISAGVLTPVTSYVTKSSLTDGSTEITATGLPVLSPGVDFGGDISVGSFTVKNRGGLAADTTFDVQVEGYYYLNDGTHLLGTANPISIETAHFALISESTTAVLKYLGETTNSTLAEGVVFSDGAVSQTVFFNNAESTWIASIPSTGVSIASGTSYSSGTFDVANTDLSPIPEPSVYAACAGLLALGFVAANRLRRSNRTEHVQST